MGMEVGVRMNTEPFSHVAPDTIMDTMLCGTS